jgi:hypothetical protein
MADDNEVAVRITADASGLRAETKEASEDVASFGMAARQAFREGVPELARLIQLFQEPGEAVAGGKGFIEQLGAAIALAFATKEIFEWAAEVTEAAEKIEHLSAQLAVATLTGTSVEEMAQQLERMQSRLATASGPAQAALKALGIEAASFRHEAIPQCGVSLKHCKIILSRDRSRFSISKAPQSSVRDGVLFRRAAHGRNVVAGLCAFAHDESMRPNGRLLDELGRFKGKPRSDDALVWPPAHGAFLSLTPGPPPFSAMNSTPPDSRAERIIARLARWGEDFSFSKFRTVTPLT